MGVSLPGTLVRSGEERATLVRRTYGLVFISVIVTALGVAFGFTQPTLMQAVAQHPIITMLAMFAPLFMAMQARRSFPRNIILTPVFTFIEGIWIAPFLFMAERGKGLSAHISNGSSVSSAGYGLSSISGVSGISTTSNS